VKLKSEYMIQRKYLLRWCHAVLGVENSCYAGHFRPMFGQKCETSKK